MNNSFLKNFGEFIQNYKELRFISDSYSEHDKNIKGGIFFEVKICLYSRIEIISVVKQNKIHNVFEFLSTVFETEAAHVPGVGKSK
jgi:hypothetical protein